MSRPDHRRSIMIRNTHSRGCMCHLSRQERQARDISLRINLGCRCMNHINAKHTRAVIVKNTQAACSKCSSILSHSLLERGSGWLTSALAIDLPVQMIPNSFQECFSSWGPLFDLLAYGQ